MAEVSESWAKSIPAENVQALANETSMNPEMEIPLRYIRPDLGHHQDNINSIIDEVVPIIDMKRLLDPNLSSQESSKLHHACMEWGFFQVVNHGVDDEVIEKMKVDLEEFFKLPLKEKEVFAPLSGGLQGYGQKLVLNEEKLEWQDMMFLITQPVLARNFRFWPTSPPTFRSTLDKYSAELKSVSMSLLTAIAKNLGLKPQVLHDVFKEQQRMRMNYYPPCPKANQVLGINPHTDAGALTILLQVSDVQGLQIKRNDQWLPVQPLPHALVVNIGDALEIVTNGKYASVEHRVIVNNKKERLSIAAYHSPSFDKIIGPLPEIVQGGKEYYKTMKFEEYMEFHFLAKVEGKNHMDFMKLNN
ncbi:(S)-norcoclaurine synthase protein [Dioscorea alata]|uniref:(S)-norcoclaurine synthase protein n=1 Tax=Dioscorea alata TaxID=55571 RepID=A0ACB7UGG9_DIOAL|nr:(S)-norcoclaurine synthase protein [Dioscorea alata]